MSRHPQHSVPDPGAMLDAYLDGQLSDADRARFESMLASDAVLRAQVERQHRIDGALNRMFIPPAISPAISRAAMLHRADVGTQGVGTQGVGTQNGALVDHKPMQEAAHSNGSMTFTPHAGFDHRAARQSRGWSLRRALAIAAALFFLLLGPVAAYQSWQAYDYGRQHFSAGHPAEPLAVVYQNEVAAGFQAVASSCGDEDDKPAKPLKPDVAFTRLVSDRFNEKVVFDNLPAGVELIGVTYPSAISPMAVALLAKSGTARIELFADSDSIRPAETTVQRADLHIFQRRIGAVVFYEVTPLDHPVLLDLIAER